MPEIASLRSQRRGSWSLNSRFVAENSQRRNGEDLVWTELLAELPGNHTGEFFESDVKIRVRVETYGKPHRNY